MPGIGIQESRSFYSYWMWTQGKATHSTANIVDGYFLEGIKLPTWINLRTLTKAQLQRSMPKDHRIIESANAKPNGGVTTELELLLWREANALKAARCRLPLNLSDQGGTSSMGQTRKKGIHTLKTRCPNYRLSRLHLWKGLGQKLPLGSIKLKCIRQDWQEQLEYSGQLSIKKGWGAWFYRRPTNPPNHLREWLGGIDSIEIVNLKIPWGLWFYRCIFGKGGHVLLIYHYKIVNTNPFT